MYKIVIQLNIVLLIGLFFSCSSGDVQPNSNIILSDNWYIKSSLEVTAPDSAISTREVDSLGWYRTSVPSTVLNALVKNNVYPDPRTGMNNFLIPDVSDSFNAKHDLAKYSYLKNKANPFKDPYWFRTAFKLPKGGKGKLIWLNFDGINYRADVWLNGHKIADGKDMAGMFLRFKFNITKFAIIGETNYLAVKIYQVDHPGNPDPGTQFIVFGPNRGHSSDIFKDETLKFSGGWDCAPVIRDRNMGIYQKVYVTTTGSVTIENPYIITDLPLPDTNLADIKITASIINNSNNVISGELTGNINLIDTLEFPTYSKSLGGSLPQITIHKQVNLKANETILIEFNSKEFPQLLISNPYLWWPNGYGKQYLHKLNLSFKTDNQVSDSRDVTFGIREVKNELNKISSEYGRVFFINGKRVFCKGGWIQPDMLLEDNTKRINDEARLMAIANVNMIGNEDAPSPSEEIMETYDKYGLMIWEVFFQCYRTYPGTSDANNPEDHDLAIREVRDIVYRYRNHPSLVIWCLENENIVCEDLYIPSRNIIKSLDSSRPFIPCTSYDWDVDKLTPYMKPDLPLGTTDDGDPDYSWNPESFYFKKILEVNRQTFRNELGSPSLPVFSSLKKFIPTLGQVKNNPVFPLDSIWAEHGAWDGDGYAYRKYDNAIRAIYGQPSSTQDYVRKAQYVNATSYRAMFEAANHRMWNITSGVMLWKLNSCWPDVCWQFYDWYLCQNAAYYYAKKAMEPIHIQMNANDRRISVINASHASLDKVIVNVQLIDFNMQTRWAHADTVTIGADRYEELFAVPKLSDLTPVYFVKIELRNNTGKLISDNLYWLSLKEPAIMTDINNLDTAKLELLVTPEETEKEVHLTINIKNPTDKLSFFNRFMVTRGIKGEEVLPTFWDSNFITLFPGEEKTIHAIISKEDLHDAKPYVGIENSKDLPVGVLPLN